MNIVCRLFFENTRDVMCKEATFPYRNFRGLAAVGEWYIDEHDRFEIRGIGRACCIRKMILACQLIIHEHIFKKGI